MVGSKSPSGRASNYDELEVVGIKCDDFKDSFVMNDSERSTERPLKGRIMVDLGDDDEDDEEVEDELCDPSDEGGVGIIDGTGRTTVTGAHNDSIAISENPRMSNSIHSAAKYLNHYDF